jgi:mRNA-degrading endonuclease YafQ of YafQ-DinJ toxin-antitoxin module
VPPTSYTLLLADEHWDAIKALPHESQQEDAIEFLVTYAAHTPKRLRPDGKLKRLRGEYRNLWQYDIDRSYRIIYSVDETARTVNVEYIGSHPSWGSGGRGRRIRN